MGNSLQSLSSLEEVKTSERKADFPDNIGQFLCDVNLINYLSINFLYNSRFYLYFLVMNKDFYENVKEEQMKYIPQNYLNVNLYRVYYDEKVAGNTLEDHRKLLLNRDPQTTSGFTLPESILKNVDIARQWKILNLKLFYQIFEKAKNDCHIHQLITKEQTKKFEPNHDNKRITISLSSTVLDPNLPQQVAQELASPTTLVENNDSFDDNLCCICLDAPVSITTGCCNAQFCERCLTDWNRKNTTCPMCRKPLDINGSEDKLDAWVTIQKEDFILPREEVANQFIRFASIKLNHSILW